MADNYSDMTPGRKTRIHFDIPEKVLVEDGWGGVRKLSEVAPHAARDKGSDNKFCSNMKLWASGCWTLRPFQERLFDTQEKTYPKDLGGQFVYTVQDDPDVGDLIDDLVLISLTMLGIKMWLEPSAAIGPGWGGVHTPGVPPPGINPYGDTFYRRTIGADESWQPTGVLAAPDARHNALVTAIAAPPPGVDLPASVATAPVDVIAVSKRAAKKDQGFCLRWIVPGTVSNNPDTVMVFYFGQYALHVQGDGVAVLWEWARPYPNTPRTWQRRFSFRYAAPAQVSNHNHMLLIWPVVGLHGEKFLHFSAAHLDASESTAVGLLSTPGRAGGATAGTTTTTERVFKWDELTAGSIDESHGCATMEGPISLAIRRDLRVMWQLSQLRFWAGGYLSDTPWSTPIAQTPRPFSVQPFSRVPDSGSELPTSLTPVITDGVTGEEQSNGTNIRQPQVGWYFTSDTRDTPVLWGYRIWRDPVIQTIAPGQITGKVSASGAGVSINSGDGDPRRETAHAEIDDRTGALSRLSVRGELSARIETDYTAPGETEPRKVVLMRGYAQRPHATKVGRDRRAGGMQAGAPVLFPSPEARRYSVDFAGMWLRLAEKNVRTALSYANFLNDPKIEKKEANGDVTPWKVTDIIRTMLLFAGFPASMVRIADNPIRMWPGGPATQSSDLVYSGMTNIAETVVALARNYLGAYLIFDANSGTEGQWTLVFAPDPNTEPVQHITLQSAKGENGSIVLPHVPGAYPANTTFVIGDIEGYTVPPEANHVCAVTAPNSTGSGAGVCLSNHLYNFQSYAVPGSTIVPDANNPHYIGRERTIIVADPSLWAGDGIDAYQKSQYAVDFLTRRIFDYACRARFIRHLRCPLTFIRDAETGNYRPLRFYDPITFGGESGWYVRSVKFDYRSDRRQEQMLEIEKLVPI